MLMSWLGRIEFLDLKSDCRQPIEHCSLASLARQIALNLEASVEAKAIDSISHISTFPTILRASTAVCWVICALCAMSVLTGCSDTNVGLLSDHSVYATATACACGCYLYGSYPHTTPSPSPSPTGKWVVVVAPATSAQSPLSPQPTQEPSHWPPPIVTCTPREDQPTVTVTPTNPTPLIPTLPTLPPNTALPAMIGSSPPISFGSMEGEALPGGIATHPLTGRPYVIWSQLNLDPGQEHSGRVYLRLTDPKTGQWLPARSVNGPGNYKIGKGAPESAVGVAPDGTIYVVYIREQGDQAVLEWRSSADNGETWSVPQTLPYPGIGMIYNVRLLVDDLNQPHITAIAKRGTDCGAEVEGCGGSGDIVYYERRPDGSWRSENRPLDGKGERQFNLAMNIFSLPNGTGTGTVRTVLGWSEKHTVFTSYKDGVDGEWQHPHFIIDGDTHPYGIQDYWPGWTGMQMLSFSYNGQQWVYFFWSLYSTGRICYVYSSDGGATWSSEDAMAYNQHVSVPDPGTPFVPLVVWGSAYEPIPFWDESHERIFVVYRFRDRNVDSTDKPSGEYFPAYAYARPHDIGRDWVGYESNATEPLRLFPSATTGGSMSFRGNDQHGGGGGKSSPAYLMWVEQTGSKEIYFATFSPATLLSGATLP